MLVKGLLATKPTEIITTTASTSIHKAMELLITNEIGCLPVIDGSNLVGIISDKDIFKKIFETKGDYHSLKVQDVITTEVIVGLPDDEIEYVTGIMEKNHIRHMPIVVDGNMIGILSLRDIVKTQAANAAVENRYLMDMLEKRDRSGDTL